MDSLISVTSAPPLWLRAVRTPRPQIRIDRPAHQVDSDFSNSGFKRSEQ